MKIAVWHNLPSGGGKRSLYHHVRGLLEKDHTVESWCPPTADQTYLPLNELITEHIVPFDWKPKSAKTPFGRLMSSYYNIADKIKAMDEHCRLCAEEINNSDFDIIFVNPCTFFRVTSIAQYIKIPKVIYIQEPYRWLYEAMPNPPWAALPSPKKSQWSPGYLKAFLHDIVRTQGLRVQVREEWQNAKAFDMILVNSSFSRESVLRAYGLEAKVCYLGIDTELFYPMNVTREKFIVGLGGIYSGKGIERAVHAIGTIEKSIRPDLIWIGNFSDEGYRKTVEALAISLSVNLSFKVRIRDEEIVAFLNRATAMIYTPLLEPFGFAPLEANACGTPVVAIAEGGVRETIKDGINGFLINGNEPIEMGKAISTLLKDEELAYRMGKQARNYVLETWTWNSAIERLEESLFNLTKEAKIKQPLS